MPKKITKKKNYYKELVALLNYSVSRLTQIKVAAIIVTDKGLFSGVNFEDLICNLSVCAERTAIYGAIAHGMKKISEVHILGSKPYMWPCGLCRQLISSFGTSKTKICVYALGAKTPKVSTLGHLLPNPAFSRGRK